MFASKTDFRAHWQRASNASVSYLRCLMDLMTGRRNLFF
jgi:hypothetical protein